MSVQVCFCHFLSIVFFWRTKTNKLRICSFHMHPLYSIMQVSLRCIKTMFDAYHFGFYFIFQKEN